MNLLCYLPHAGAEPGGRYWPLLTWRRPGVVKEVFQSLEGFAQGLREPGRGRRCALAVPAGRDDLERLLARAELLREVALVLFLPDAGKETVARAHLLRPRFLAGPEVNVDDALMVAARLLGLEGRRTARAGSRKAL